MASNVLDPLDITTCSICFETFSRPKYLPCLHSFCEGCIRTFIVSLFQKDATAKGITCPICRDSLVKPDDIDPEKWAEKLPVNHLLVNIIDFNKAKKDSENCHLCSKENKSESAQSWCVHCRYALCKTCECYHRKFETLGNHKIISLSELDRTEAPFSCVDMYCSEHPDKRLEAYCYDHTAVCCIPCVTIKHRKCANVSTIDTAANEKRLSSELSELKKSFSEIEGKLISMQKRQEQNLAHLVTKSTDLKSEIAELFENASRNLDELRLKAMQEVDDCRKETDPVIQTSIDDVKCKLSAVENNSTVLETSSKHASNAQFLQDVRNLSEQKTNLDRFTSEQEIKIDEYDIEFSPNQPFFDILRKMPSVGEIRVVRKNSEKVDRQESMNMPKSQTRILNVQEISVASPVTGISFINNDQIIISNQSAQRVELLDCHLSSQSSLYVQGKPWGIRMSSKTNGAVAVEKDNSSCLLFFKVVENKIVMDQIVEVEHPQVYCFDFFKGTLYIGGPNIIARVDKKLKIQHEFQVSGNVLSLVRCNDFIFYTLEYDNTLYCNRKDGSLVFQIENDLMKDLHGVTIGPSLSIYVCGNTSNNVCQVSREGTPLGMLLPIVPHSPYYVSFNKKGDKLAVGCLGRVVLYNVV